MRLLRWAVVEAIQRHPPTQPHIPERYLHGSVAQRLALLQGLMDTDGTMGSGGSGSGRGSGRGAGEFSVVHERLACDVHELLLGLGIKVTFGWPLLFAGAPRPVSGTGGVSRRVCRCSGCRGRPGGLPRCACGGRCSGT